MKRKVIVVTDGDKVAKRTVEVAAKNIGGRCISLSWGNPTTLEGPEMIDLIKSAAHDPVVVMLDDKGFTGPGRGEQVLAYLRTHPDIELLGVVAVASNTSGTQRVPVTESVSSDGEILDCAVDKDGVPLAGKSQLLKGDTVEIIKQLNIPVVVGTGDTGKMHGLDHYRKGAPITTKALEEVLRLATDTTELRGDAIE